MSLKLCFAYKAVSSINQIGINVYLDGDITIKKNAYIPITTTSDNNWHYTCIDLYQGLLNSWSTTSSFYPAYRITLTEVNIKKLTKRILDYFLRSLGLGLSSC